MNLVFPATSDELIRQNPKAYPDSVRALLRFQELTGEVRLIRGRYYSIRKDKDEDIRKAYSKPEHLLTALPYALCLVCGNH